MSTQVERLRPLVLNVGLAIHDGDWNWKNVSSPFMRLYYVTEGSAQVVLPNKTVLLSEGNLYFIPAFTKHNYVCNTRFSHYYLHLYEEPGQETGILDEWELPIEISADEQDLMLMKRLCTINPHMGLPQSDPASYDNDPTLIQNLARNKQRAFCDKVESRGIVLQLLAHFLKRAVHRIQSQDSRIEASLIYIRKHICEPMDLDVLVGQACLSKDHFIRLFRQETGQTPLQYINHKKIEKAQLLLLTGDMPVKNIAFALAFDDYSYFNRLFKKIVGITPLEYRKQYSLPPTFRT